jgi:transmembrane sensor
MPTPNDKDKLAKIAQNYLKGTASDAERRLFDEWFVNEDPNEFQLKNNQTEDEHREKHLAMIHKKAAISDIRPRRGRTWLIISAAAAILVGILIGAYYFIDQNPTPQSVMVVNKPSTDIKPGGNKAILTLSNGQKIVLNDAKKGLIARQGAANINNKGAGQLIYSNNPSDQAKGANLVNTIETPRGGKYKLVMSDGTVAILDAASSISYPVAFSGNERRVKITGQVYFEVVHNSKKPFYVETRGQTVEDLGTIFNINSYVDEPEITTTLINGSVSVSKINSSVILKPGQQAVNQLNRNIKVGPADIDEAVAWKNDYFVFNDENIDDVMRKVSRWYDVDIEYRDKEKIKETYLGSMTRYSNVSEVLKMLEITGDVKFSVQGRKIIVKSTTK